MRIRIMWHRKIGAKDMEMVMLIRQKEFHTDTMGVNRITGHRKVEAEDVAVKVMDIHQRKVEAKDVEMTALGC